MSTLSSLKPQALWQHFETMCSIPHPSKHEQAMIDWVTGLATEHQLEHFQDAVGNVIIKKPATAGMENRQGVILQAHLDMVPQANNDTQHDFTKDPIRPYIDGDWVTAEGTTLGADNGIGGSSILAVLTSNDIAHGPIEALFTIDEEAGMTGAFGLQAGVLEGKLLINTDSEQEGEVYMGCAGGGDTSISFASEYQATNTQQLAIELSVTGLKGGHSGCDIDTGRANANKLLVRIVAAMQQQGFEPVLCNIQGGSLRNAIPREASTKLVYKAEQQAALAQFIASQIDDIVGEFGAVETDLEITAAAIDTPSQSLTGELSQQIVASLNACTNGVVSMSQAVEGVVETSLNLGVISQSADSIDIKVLVRSLIDSSRLQVEASLASLFSLTSASVSFSGAYPGWKPETDSVMKTLVQDSYQELFGKCPNVMVIHAGLECGLFKSAYPEWDMASFGPTIKFPHSPDEKVEIAAVEKYWQLLVAVLKNAPVKV
ncbi:MULTISPECIES: aminoacyl-histidine dipeptidase [unclassified Agarivorans]|uniref:aminoacyl-histidine dipeptidase n=1 Tax=unclassified Agarivorans TaxID=2636026 RepID=UPI0026E257F3|nr:MULTISPECIES: aminoacyl-histidine dipeptidase [unclassified Agarivorans]MDO6687652.1 aminoacyl-histidine dipeptidase [Agarivorans sp. 3_MG-2023]MDO6717206.1 aminoacyl-histidine dipeptidase [Agarivorans sp. 2_MG-2023]